MPYRITNKENYLHIEWHGVIGDQDLRSLGAELPAIAASLGRAPDVLHSFDEATGSSLAPWEAFQHSLRREDTRLANCAKSAGITRTPEVAAMFNLMRELNRNPSIRMEAFPTEEAALRWLSTPGV